MNCYRLFGFIVLSLSFLLSGCVARTYMLTRDRVDQNLTAGNRGYLMGDAPAVDESNRKDTRATRVVEIELGFQKKVPARCPATTPVLPPVSEESSFSQDAGLTEPAAVSTDFQDYKVGKNDTLQKISKKFYGTTKKWPKIYEANKDVLRGPDKLYPGQTLKIPADGITKTEEVKENLK